MTADEITAFVESLPGVLVQRPAPGDGTPEIAWGDLFFFYAPDGVAPKTQPFATVVTKTYPDEPPTGLDAPGSFRVNLGTGTREFRARLGRDPKDPPAPGEPPADAADAVIAHPTYGAYGWLAVRDPGPASDGAVRELLTQAHALAQGRAERRS